MLTYAVKQGGVAVALKDEALMDITKSVVLKEKSAYIGEHQCICV